MIFIWVTVSIVAIYGSVLMSYIILMNIFALKELEISSNENYKPNISIITATHNEISTIQNKIDNLLKQDYPHNLIEWVIIDDISIDGTRDVIEDFIQKSPFKINFIKREKRYGLSNSLNHAYKIAKGDIIFKSDSDILMGKKVISEIVPYFADSSIGAVSAVARLENKSVVEKGYKNIFTIFRIGESNMDSTYVFQPVSAFRKKLIKKIRENSLADDGELALIIRKQGFRTVYNNKAFFYEKIPSKFRERRQLKDRRAKGHVHLLPVFIDMIFRPKYGAFGMYILPMNFFLIFISPYLLLVSYLMIGITILLYSPLIASIYFTSIPILVVISYFIPLLNSISAFVDANLSILIATFKILTTKEVVCIWEIQRETMIENT